MKYKTILAVAVMSGATLTANRVVAQPQAGNTTGTTPAKTSKTPPLRSRSCSVVQADPQGGAAYLEATRPIVVLEEQARRLLQQGDLQYAEQVCLQAIAARDKVSSNGESVSDRNLLGDIYVKGGQYEAALAQYLPNYKHTESTGMNLSVALCYLRLGNYSMAQRYYSDQAILQYSPEASEYLPGTSTARSLEASILLARGMNSLLHSEEAAALSDLEAANKFAPNNGYIAFFSGMSLLRQDHWDEAVPYFRQALQCGHSKIKRMAQEYVATYTPAR